ncbi:type 1 glutamine amidotransferase domain-containing protein [Shimia sp. MIT1388]|uniref:type 1 glutamine amidotransferase domain-containing protein n=1 Tax=Shimia sp. MIT1388 TaxID=3096992 RepID=UPI00399B01D9
MKALIIVTNHTEFGDAKTAPTGLWLSELTHFYDVFEKAGVQMEIVSPKGGKITIDQRSLGFFVVDRATKRRHQDPAFMALLDNTKSITQVRWDDYDVVYFAGGHGAMWDFAEDAALHAHTAAFYESGKVVSAVCHGVAALQNVKLSDGSYLVAGKRGTAFAYFDETIAGVKSHVPYNLEKRLKQRGMHYSKALVPLKGHTVADGRLITGQNPNSATETAQKTLDALHAA